MITSFLSRFWRISKTAVGGAVGVAWLSRWTVTGGGDWSDGVPTRLVGHASAHAPGKRQKFGDIVYIRHTVTSDYRLHQLCVCRRGIIHSVHESKAVKTWCFTVRTDIIQFYVMHTLYPQSINRNTIPCYAFVLISHTTDLFYLYVW